MANRFIDPTYATGTLAGTWTFTNGSTSVTGTGGNATILSAGDYVKPSTTNEWYKIASITDDNSFTLAYAFAQTTQTDVSCQYNSEDGTSASTPLCHINQATTDEIRTAGDVIYLRRGQTYLYEATDIIFDEDGTPSSPITLMGDDGTGWPTESGYSKPIIDFNNSTRRIVIDNDENWHFKDIEVKNEGGTIYNSGGFYVNSTRIILFENVTVHGCASRGINTSGSQVILRNCEFYDNTTYNTYVNGITEIYNCTFNGGTLGTSYGIYARGMVYIYDSSLGETTSHSGYDIYCFPETKVWMRNTKLSSTNKYYLRYSSSIYIEDKDGSVNVHESHHSNGDIYRDTTTCLLYTSPSPRDLSTSRMPSSA